MLNKQNIQRPSQLKLTAINVAEEFQRHANGYPRSFIFPANGNVCSLNTIIQLARGAYAVHKVCSIAHVAG